MQILEGVRKGLAAVFLQELPEGDFISCLLPDGFRVVGIHRVPGKVLCHLGIDLLVRDPACKVCDLADPPVLDLPAVLDLAGEAVAVGDGDVTHVVAEGRNAQVL